MKLAWTFLFILFLLPLLSASNHTPEDTIFSKLTESINPPATPGRIPSGGLTGSQLPSQDTDKSPDEIALQLRLLDAQTDAPITNVHVLIEIENDISYKTLNYVGNSGILELALPPSAYTLVLKADDISTPGGDHYASADLALSQPIHATINFLPVGSVRGKVIKRDQLIRGARISFTCSGLYGDMSSLETDEFGSFNSQWLPPGTCIARATDGSEVGSAEFQITPGTLQDITIELKTPLSSASLLLYLLLFIILVIAVLMHLYLIKRPKKKSHPITKSKRIDDIITTLSSKEKDVMNLLIKEGDVTQAKIIYSLMIPKTTLTRILEKLEKKQAITIQKFGKSKKISLTDWILEKEKKGP